MKILKVVVFSAILTWLIFVYKNDPFKICFVVSHNSINDLMQCKDSIFWLWKR